MNATLAVLLEADGSEAEKDAVRALARSAGLLWWCEPCGQDVECTKACAGCLLPPPRDTAEAPRLTVYPVVTTGTGKAITVCDDADDAAALVEWWNELLGAELVAVGTEVPHNERPDERLLDAFEHTVPDKTERTAR